MPRRSAADISIVPMLPGKGRPEPPAMLDVDERRAWRDVIDALPDQWTDAAAQLVLRRLVAQVAVAERLERRLRRLTEIPDDAPEGPEAMAIEKELAAAHRDTMKAVVHGLTTLRATPRSRMAAREGRSRFERGASFSRPWEIVAAKKPGGTDGSAS
jgi:hypothetical protein